MRHTELPLKEFLIAVGVSAALLALLPLLGVALFVLRFILLGVAVVALASAAMLYVTSAGFRGRFHAFVDSEIEYKGLRLENGVRLDRSHVWARVEPDGAFVGVDDLAEACLGPVASVDLPLPGDRVRRGETLFRLGHGERLLNSPAPIDGVVIAANEALRSDPQRVNRDPYGLGWIVRIRPDDPKLSRRLLLSGHKAQQWFRHEIDRLLASLSAGPLAAIPDDLRSPELALTSLPDGGQVVEHLDQIIDSSTWESLQRSFFGPASSRNEEVAS